MAPFDINFAQGRFYECFTTPKLVGCFGLVNQKEELDFLNNLQGEALDKVRSEREKVELEDNEKAKALLSVLHRYARYANSGERLRFLKYFHAPQHIWSVSDGIPYDFEEKIKSINIYVSEQLHNQEMFRKKVHTLVIDG